MVEEKEEKSKEKKQEKQKEEKKKKEYETLKIKRGGLEKLRDVFSIIRDLLIIIILVGLVLVVLLAVPLILSLGNLVGSSQSGGLGSILSGLFGGAVGGLGGNFPIPNIETSLNTVKGDSIVCNLLSGFESDISNSDTKSASQKLTQLKSSFNKRGWTEQAQLSDKLIKSMSSGDFNEIVSLYTQLKTSVQGCS